MDALAALFNYNVIAGALHDILQPVPMISTIITNGLIDNGAHYSRMSEQIRDGIGKRIK